MPNSPALTLNSPRSSALWSAIHQIPDAILSDYLSDNVIDDKEIEDITLRLEGHMPLTITPADHDIIRKLVYQAVEHMRLQANVKGTIEGKLCKSTLADIRAAMGHLMHSGQIALKVVDASADASYKPNEAIPEERPEGYDEAAPNTL